MDDVEEKMLKVYFECIAKIKKLKLHEAQNKRIIDTLTNELEASRNSQAEAEGKANAIVKSMEEMKSSHLDIV